MTTGFNNHEKELEASKSEKVISPQSSKATRGQEEEKDFFDDLAMSEAMRQTTYREPLTHIKNRNPLENILGTCFGDFNAKLTYNQLIPFYKIKEDVDVLFDAKCTEYDDLFRELWKVLTDENLDTIQNERWKYYGFQNANPRSDLRGGGLISLKQMISYAKSHKEKVKEMVAPEHEFLFAVSSINITYFLFRYYHLSSLLVYEKDWKEICSRIALKSFCILLEDDHSTYNKLHAMLLEDLFEVWLEIKRTLPEATLLDFNKATDTVKERYRAATNKNIFDDWYTLKTHYEKKKAQIPPIRLS